MKIMNKKFGFYRKSDIMYLFLEIGQEKKYV